MKTLAALLFLAYVAGGLPAADAARAGGHYQFPADELTNVRQCFTLERQARNIPDGAAYFVWWEANEGTAQEADWSAAYDRCTDQYLWTEGKWNFDHMVRVS